MVAEAQRAPQVVRGPMTAFSTHPRLADSDPRRALEKLLYRLERIRAVYEAVDQNLLEAHASEGCPTEAAQAHLLVVLGNENLDDAIAALDVIHAALPVGVAA